MNADGIDTTTAPASEAEYDIGEADADWHPLAVRLWNGAIASGQVRFYEPSDYETLRLTCHSLSLDLREQYVGVTAAPNSEPIFAVVPLKGASLSAYLKAFGLLGMTEGDRRRMRIELEHGPQVDEHEERANATITDLRSRLTGGGH